MRMNDLIRKVVNVSPSDQCDRAAQAMRDNGIASAVVVDGGVIVGILTERDILTKIVAENRQPNAVTVGEIMTQVGATSPGEQVRGRLVDVLGSPATSLEDAEGVYELALTGAPIDIATLPGEE
jgi:CBS domain-containing protein